MDDLIIQFVDLLCPCTFYSVDWLENECWSIKSFAVSI